MLDLETVTEGQGVVSQANGHICYLGLGSNMNNPRKQLELAISYLNNNDLVNLFAVSKFHISKPYGPIQEQEDFVNAVVGLRTFHSPFTILSLCNAIENALGRVRSVRWGPRVIDLDVLLFGDRVINTKKLIVPHVDMYNRDFVIKPLTEIKI